MKVYSNSVAKIIAVNVVIFFIQSVLFTGETLGLFFSYFGLVPALVLQKGYVWQIFSYMFLHGGLAHILFNMYALFIFGVPIEQTWGTKRFLQYYFLTGIGAGLTIFIINAFIYSGAATVPTIGASGAIFGVLLAFGMVFPNTEIYLFFFIPLKAKYLVLLYGLFTMGALLSAGGGGAVSHAGHLGGLLFGFLYFLYYGKFGKPLRSRSFNAAKKYAVKEKEHQGKSNISLINILKKIKESGFDSLTDDEFQEFKYMDIMLENKTGTVCSEKDFDINDSYCETCALVENCTLREIKKYIK
ncbi:MAG: rhomboid family intramembrane serine protease [Spirochaetia bacterium]|jgi:membrane associated rhomboid family serine protease|nr:rhomboid family intramembrane serine protease [Spirochaetia bacterium]